MGQLSETQHQIRVIKWSQQPSIRQKWPELKLLYHTPNETLDAIERKQKLMMGMKPGVPDLFLPVARGGWYGLYIEMKTECGRASSDQKWWLEQLETQGYCCTVCRGWEAAVHVLEWYLGELGRP